MHGYLTPRPLRAIVRQSDILRAFNDIIYPVYRFDGTVKGASRQTRIKQFESCTNSAVMPITAISGGPGLNLTATSHVILCKPWWRESDELQAVGWAHRLGQKDPVYVYRLSGLDALVDEVMRRMSKRKAEVNNRIMGQILRPDDEEPRIPKQEKWGAGEG